MKSDTINAEAYPLYWPENRPRTPGHQRRPSNFDTGFGKARDELFSELKMLGAKLPVLSTNIALRRDGLPLAGQRQPDDPGVAVYFTRNNRQLCFACDRWQKVEENLWAVCKTINALRGIARWGTGDMIEAAFTGFQAIGAPPVGKHWWEVFGIPPHSSTSEGEGAYRVLAMRHHPDRGGDPEKMAEINAAYEAFKRERGIR